MQTADERIAGEFAQTAVEVLGLLLLAAVSSDPLEIRRLRRAAASQLSTCAFLAGHIRRELAVHVVPDDAAGAVSDVRCEQAQ
jgi:hypothetical protein